MGALVTPSIGAGSTVIAPGYSATATGTRLSSAYMRTKTLYPNGAAITATNRAQVLIAPGAAVLASKAGPAAALTLNGEYVDIMPTIANYPEGVLISQSASAAWTGPVLDVQADDVIVDGVNVKCSDGITRAATRECLRRMPPFYCTSSFPLLAALVPNVFDSTQGVQQGGALNVNNALLLWGRNTDGANATKSLPAPQSRMLVWQALGRWYQDSSYYPIVGEAVYYKFCAADGTPLVTVSLTVTDASSTALMSIKITTDTDSTGVTKTGIITKIAAATLYHTLDMMANPVTQKANVSISHSSYLDKGDGLDVTHRKPIGADVAWSGTPIAKLVIDYPHITTGNGVYQVYSYNVAAEPYVGAADSFGEEVQTGISQQTTAVPLNYLANVNYIEQGVSGRSIRANVANGLCALVDAVPGTELWRPMYAGHKYAVVGPIGGNDVGQTAITAEANEQGIKDGFQNIIEGLVAMGMLHIIVFGIAPRVGREAGAKAVALRVDEFIQSLKSPTCPFDYVDLNISLGDGLGGAFQAGYSLDGVHPNTEAGRVKIVSLLAPFLRSQYPFQV